MKDSMKRDTFWGDAGRGGLALGATEVLFSLLGIWSNNSLLVGLCHLIACLWLMRFFTGRRSLRFCKTSGYSYGEGWLFIVTLSLLAGVVLGAFEIFARNWFFPTFYREQLAQSLTLLAQTKLYTTAQLAEMKQYTEQVLFAPFWIVVTDVMAMALKGAFFGLFVAAFTRCEADPFYVENEENE